jgi:hypothetical protein
MKNKRERKMTDKGNEQERQTRQNDKSRQVVRVDDDHNDDQLASNRFAAYQGTQKIKANNDKPTLVDSVRDVRTDQPAPTVTSVPLKKRLSVQFYPVERVQFISNRLGRSDKPTNN